MLPTRLATSSTGISTTIFSTIVLENAHPGGVSSPPVKTLPFTLLPLAITASLHAAPQPDFQLPEINDNTDRAGQTVSPRDYRQFISVYYFGHET